MYFRYYVKDCVIDLDEFFANGSDTGTIDSEDILQEKFIDKKRVLEF